MKYALWIVQGLLALLFAFGGVMKLVMPIEELTAQMPLPGFFIQFIAVCEILGALGLVLPGLLKIRTELTSLAAMGLVVIMIGATVISAVLMGIGAGMFPLMVGALAAMVSWARAPRSPRRQVARRSQVVRLAA